MKRIIATIGLLCVGLSGAGHETNAQVTINIFNLNDVLRAKPIDETRFTVQYQTTSMPDTLQPDKKEEETLMLKVGDKCSVYYSYAKFLTDSVLEADKAAVAHVEARHHGRDLVNRGQVLVPAVIGVREGPHVLPRVERLKHPRECL